MRASPRILFETLFECVSRMQTAEPVYVVRAYTQHELGKGKRERAKGAVLLDVPLPRRIASRPVSWIAETILLGGAVPSMKISWSFRLASTLLIPDARTVRHGLFSVRPVDNVHTF